MTDFSQVPLWITNKITLYRWVPHLYIESPINSSTGFSRFNNGTQQTVYLADSAQGAIAEYYRAHPEFLEKQDKVQFALFELEFSVDHHSVDIRQRFAQDLVKLTFADLFSSDFDKSVRYLKCQDFSLEVSANGFSGILYPSASANWGGAWNLVLYGESPSPNWRCINFSEVAKPHITSSDIRFISPV